VLRTLDDAVALRTDLERAASLLVIGGGFIGAEVASAACRRDVAVTVLEALPVPFVHVLGEEVGTLCGRLLTEAGVDLRVDSRVADFLDAGDRVAVSLADGTRLDADVAVVGVGGEPRLDWLAGSGISAADGLACDLRGRVEGAPGVWAVGDVAAWPDPVHGDRHRIEHWTSAGNQAAAVARDILGADPPKRAVPYVWSDQFGLKIQVFGRPELADAIVPLHGDGLGGGPVRGTVVGYTVGGRLVGVAGFGTPRLTVRYRDLVAARAGADDARRHAADLS
jgi:NADPH-dependent 2,4-dienoyl-CoA reductase/sulfur reductase-like enzyme